MNTFSRVAPIATCLALATALPAAAAPTAPADRAPRDPDAPARPSELFRDDRPPQDTPDSPSIPQPQPPPSPPRTPPGSTRHRPRPDADPPAAAPNRPANTRADTTPNPPPGRAHRHPVPDPAARAQALDLLRELFADEYRRVESESSAPAVKELANELIRQSQAMRQRTTPDDISSRYVLLTEIINLSASIADYATALNTARDLSDHYDIDGPALTLDLAARAAREPTDPARLGPVMGALFTAIDDAVSAGDLPAAATLQNHADALARKSKDVALATEAQRRRKDLRDLQTQYRTLAQSLETLRTNPDDPGANTTAGRFRCLVAGDFAAGLPLLARSSDPQFRALAAADLRGADSSGARADLGDAWWALAEQHTGRAQSNLRARSAHWYRQALSGLGGLKRTLVERRIAAAPVPPPGAPAPTSDHPPARPPVVVTGAPPGGAADATPPDPAPSNGGKPPPGPAQPGDRLLQLLATKFPPEARPVPGEARWNAAPTEQWLKTNVRPGTPITATVQIQHGGGLQRHPNTKIPYVYVTFRVPQPVEHDGIQHNLDIAVKLEGQKALDAVTIAQGTRGQLTGTVTDLRLGGWSGNKERGLGAITFLMMLDNVRFTPAEE